MPRPHVLMLGWEFPPLVSGGLGVACEGIVGALRKKTDLTLMLPDAQNHGSTPISPYQDDSSGLYGTNLPEAVEHFTHQKASETEKLNFDLIHAHDWMTAKAGLEIKNRTGKPLVFHTHSLSYDRAGPDDPSWIDDIERQAIQEADLVVAVSEYTREICLEHYDAAPDKTVVVHNGIRPVQAYRSERPFPDQLVIFVGRLASQKNPRGFLEIARRVLDQNTKVRFAMAGAGDELFSLMGHALRLGIREKVHFTGFLNRPGLHHLLSMADVLCMPSKSEPFGLAALEAAQFGVPIVISDKSGVSELLQSVKTAAPDDVDTFAGNILDLLEEDHKRPPLNRRSWNEVADELLRHYRKLLT